MAPSPPDASSVQSDWIEDKNPQQCKLLRVFLFQAALACPACGSRVPRMPGVDAVAKGSFHMRQ